MQSAVFFVVFCAAEAAVAEPPVDFVRDVRPVLQRHCYSCHSGVKQKSGLRVDLKAAAFKGGELFGPSLVAGRPEDSPLLRVVRGDEPDVRMPPEGEGLSATEIGVLTRWIKEGAAWPDGVDRTPEIDPRRHWAFQPLTRPPPPATSRNSWAHGELDLWIAARLAQAGLHPAPEADRMTWLRRVTLDLTGLPPTPEEVQAFLRDNRPDAFERTVDELLASPHYGERWAQHWLDVVRYADTHGFEVNTERPNAWPYRDYVIDAFNRDVPYDRSIREQIVGDALGADAATGFLITASVLLPGQIGQDEPSKRLARQDALDEIVVNIGQTFLGLSIGCARCHDHKFDPISQRDYYSLQAFVAGVEYADRDLRTPAAEAARREEQQLKEQLSATERQLAAFVPRFQSGTTRPAVNPRLNVDRFAPVTARRLRFTIQATNNLEPCLDELEVFDGDGANWALAANGTKATSSGDTIVNDRHEMRFVNDGRYGNSRSWMSNEMGKGWVELEFPQDRVIDRVVWGRDREGKYADRLAVEYRIEVAGHTGEWQTVADSSDRAKYSGENKAVPFSTAGLSDDEAQSARKLMAVRQSLESRIQQAANAQKVFAGIFRTPDNIHRLLRGDPEQPREPVEPAVLSSIGPPSVDRIATEQDRRRVLADWIASPQHPLTARVMVNRIWQGHFGTGLVDTPNDFGLNGARPSHPELLDWLADELIRSGWSLKHMHRLIVLSATYRQSSQNDPAAATTDAAVRLLWRFPTRRLDAESIRDGLLAVSGRLDSKMGGRGFDLFQQRGGLSGFTAIESPSGEGLRRMIYAHKVRRERDAVFGAFDCPDAGQSTARRRESTTPIQALNLFNSRFTLDAAGALAKRVQSEVDGEPRDQVRRAFQLVLLRDPRPDELAESESVVKQFGLATLGRVLLNSNEFLFLP